ncbi:hypothetical protein FQA39_LY02751 [Lamprigera yunnana]|nr:hypothetical protein FQA39_LY02751 [Lamprigera yunnana]
MAIRPLSKELQNLAETELNEVPKRINRDLLDLRKWIKKQPHLNVKNEDQFLLNFLRGCKFSLEKTKQKLECFYTYRTLAPDFFQNRDPFLPEIQEILQKGCFWLPFPKAKDPKVPRVLYLSAESLNSLEVNVVNVMKVNFMIIDILMNEDDSFIIAGHQLFHNLKGVSLNHILQITPSFLKKSATCLRDAYPLRPKELHFINLTNSIETLIKPFFSGKNLQRLKFHSELKISDLHMNLPKSILPKEFEGEADSLQEMLDEWKRKVESYRSWFLSDSVYRSDESKRIGKPKQSNDAFGIEGSFRKLEID